MGSTIKAGKEQVLLGVRIDSDLIVKEQKLHACINKGFEIHELAKAPHSQEVVYHLTV